MTRPIRRPRPQYITPRRKPYRIDHSKRITYWVELPDEFFETKRGVSSVLKYRAGAKAHRKAVALLDQHPVVYVTRLIPAIGGGAYCRRWEYKRIR